MKIPKYFKLAIAIIISELAGIIGSFFTTTSITTWYATLLRPDFYPPNWIFAPVWTILFAFMGIALFLIWEKGLTKKDVRIAFTVFFAQLALNILWSILFFGLHNPGAALIEIFSLWLAILTTIISFYKISKTASYLLIPYILWVSFAAYLNYSIWILN